MWDCYPLRNVFSHYGDLLNLSHKARYLIETTARDLTDAQNRLIQIESHINKLLGIY